MIQFNNDKENQPNVKTHYQYYEKELEEKSFKTIERMTRRVHQPQRQREVGGGEHLGRRGVGGGDQVHQASGVDDDPSKYPPSPTCRIMKYLFYPSSSSFKFRIKCNLRLTATQKRSIRSFFNVQFKRLSLWLILYPPRTPLPQPM